ncbi:MAG: hypothetical protein ACN6N1_08660, partial [Acinetobacter guillouiae]
PAAPCAANKAVLCSCSGLWLKLSQPKLKLENSLTIFIQALRRIHLLLNFNLQRKRFMKCQQTL